jgi:hypothetical protein
LTRELSLRVAASRLRETLPRRRSVRNSRRMLLHMHPKGRRDHVDCAFTKGAFGAVAAKRDCVLRFVKCRPNFRRAVQEWPLSLPQRSVCRRALAAISTLRAPAARKSNSHSGLFAAIRSIAACSSSWSCRSNTPGPKETSIGQSKCCGRSPHSGLWSMTQHLKACR